MAKHTKVIRLIREKVRNQEYEFVIPHFFEEMANDDLAFDDIESAIMNGGINRIFKDDPRGTRYEIFGTTVSDRTIAVICRIKETGNLMFSTTWEDHE